MSINNKQIRRYNHRVHSRDIDFRREATLTAICDYIQYTAADDADINGLGVLLLNEKHNASWVMTRFAMEIFRMPKEHEELTITTWVSEITRVMTTRNFEIFDHDGNRLVAAVSNWAMIDLSSRRPLDLQQLDTYTTMKQDFEPPISLPHKLGVFEAQSNHQYQVKYSDLDFNRHANSMKYLQWAIDTLPMEVLTTKNFTRIDVNFLLESLNGDNLVIATGKEEENKIKFEIFKGDKTVCRICIATK